NVRDAVCESRCRRPPAGSDRGERRRGSSPRARPPEPTNSRHWPDERPWCTPCRRPVRLVDRGVESDLISLRSSKLPGRTAIGSPRMKCPRCQHETPAGQKFCGECGARLAAVCPSCGTSNPPGQKFCGECGASLGQGAASGKFASPETYTPKHLAEKIL